MFRKLFVWVLAVLALLSLPFGATLAQEGPQVYCGDLPEADCALLADSQAAMMEVESAAFDLAMEVSLSGMEMMAGVRSLTVGLSAEGAFAVDPAALAAISDLSAIPMTGEAPEDMGEMMTAGIQALVTFLRSISGQATLTLDLPAELQAELPPQLPEVLALDLIMVDGVLYADIGPFMPAEAAEAPGWIGLDLATMYEQMFTALGAEMGEMTEMMEGLAFFDSDFITMMYDPAFLGEFITLARLGDVEHMGQTMAVFETTLDYGALLGSETFMTAFQDYMETIMGMGGELPADFDVAAFNEMMRVLGEGIQFSVVEWIGLDDHYVHHTEVAMTFEMDFAALAEMMPEGADMEDLPQRFTLGFNLALDVSAFNEPVEVAAPEDAQMIPLGPFPSSF